MLKLSSALYASDVGLSDNECGRAPVVLRKAYLGRAFARRLATQPCAYLTCLSMFCSCNLKSNLTLVSIYTAIGITFGLVSTLIGLISVFISYLTLRAMHLDACTFFSSLLSLHQVFSEKNRLTNMCK
jgi:hypothetical protein